MELSEPGRNIDNQEAIQNTDSLLHFDYYNVKKAFLILRSLNNKPRQRMLKIINEEKKINVTEIYVKLRCEQSVASQHLGILRNAGIVSTQHEGKFVYYSINDKRVDSIERFVKNIVG